MKPLSNNERIVLIRDHAAQIEKCYGLGRWAASDVIAAAQRIIELASHADE